MPAKDYGWVDKSKEIMTEKNNEWRMNEWSHQIGKQPKILLNGKMPAFTAGELCAF